jgi:hypothetical protein
MEMFLFEVNFTFHAASNKFRVINMTIVVGIEHVNQVFHLLTRLTDPILFYSLKKLIACYASIAILVHYYEKLA